MISLLVIGFLIIAVTLSIYYSYDQLFRKKYENHMIGGISLGVGLVFLGGGSWSLKKYQYLKSGQTSKKFKF